MTLTEKVLRAYKVVATQEMSNLTGFSYEELDEMLTKQAIKLMTLVRDQQQSSDNSDVTADLTE